MTSATQTRRTLLGAGLGALATSIWTAFGRPAQVRAEGQPVVVGGEYTDATSQTLIQNQTNNASVIVAQAGPGGTGLVGIGSNATGVAGSSGSGIGVYADSLYGVGLDANTGQGSAAVKATAFLSTGTAIKALNPNGGTALQTQGLLKFGTSGIATIGATRTSVTVNPGVDVSNASFVLLTPMSKLGGRSLWFTLDVVNDRFTIRISTSRASATKVSWLLLNLPT